MQVTCPFLGKAKERRHLKVATSPLADVYEQLKILSP